MVANRALVLSIAAFCLRVATAAPIVIAEVAPQGPHWLYTYTVEVAPADDARISSVILGDISSWHQEIATPEGWYLSTPVEPPAVLWIASTPQYFGSNANSDLVFSFRSRDAPGAGMIFLSLDAVDQNGVDYYLLDVPVPMNGFVVPEPSTALLVAGGLLVVILRARKT